MWILAGAIFLGCKWLTWCRTPIRSGSLPRQIGYFCAWPGLDTKAFFSTRPTFLVPTRQEWLFASLKTVLGLTLFYSAGHLVSLAHRYIVGWIGMIGIVFTLHFGLFHLLSCAWRTAGVEARPLMNWPIASVRLSDFWGRRWNTAFRDLTHRFLFKPLAIRLGPRGALATGFLTSGLIHDAVISYPAGGGYGGPTLYFSIQAAGLFLERTKAARKLGIGSGKIGWLFTLSILALPAPLLFHRPFVTRIIIPFMHAMGAI